MQEGELQLQKILEVKICQSIRACHDRMLTQNNQIVFEKGKLIFLVPAQLYLLCRMLGHVKEIFTLDLEKREQTSEALKVNFHLFLQN